VSVEPSPLSTVGRALRRRHWLVWGVTLAACAVAFAATLVRPPTYQATAILALDETQSTNQGFDIAMQADQYLTQRYIAMATSQTVLVQVCAREGSSCDPVTLSRQVSATALKTTGLIAIGATASSAATAARLANEVAAQVQSRNQSEVDAYLGPQRRLLEGQLSQLGAQVTDIERSIAAAQAPGRSDSAVSNSLAPMLLQLQQVQSQYSSTYTRLQDLQVLQTRLGGSLVVEQPASPPARPADPDPLRYLLVGGAGGLAAGFLAALAAERYRNRIQDSAELAEATGTPVVLVVDGSEPTAALGPYGFLGYSGLLGQPGPAQIVLVAASAGEPVDELAMAMAEAVMEDHRRVLVLPAALNGQASQQPEEPGASEVVVRAGVAQASRGRPERFDLTIRCLPGPLWLSRAPGPAFLVATRGRARISDARRTSQVLRGAGVEPAAAILLAPDVVERWREHRGGEEEPGS
jgi:capsular polysaccharide biosynthesis protein